jgi:hypothetical protein
MAGISVQPGQTYQLTGTISADEGVSAYGSRVHHQTGGVISVTGHATNDGFLSAGEGYGGPGAEAKIIITGVLTNNSDLSLFGGFKGYGLPASGAYMRNAGVFHNVGSVIIYGGGIYDDSFLGTGATLSNAGTITNTGSIRIAAAYPTQPIPNTGGLLLDSGQLLNAGTIDIAASYLSADPGTLSVTGTMRSSGEIQLGGGFRGAGIGAQLNISGSAWNAGTITVAGGESGSVTPPDSGGTIDVAGVLLNQGLIGLYGGGGSSVSQKSTGATLIDSGTVHNSGTILLTEKHGYYANATLSVTSTGVLSNSSTIGGNGTLFNDGAINTGATGSTASAINSYLINNGVVYVLPGTALSLGGFSTSGSEVHEGVFDLFAQSTLSISGQFTQQEVAFLGAGATLDVGNLFGFAGTLDIAHTPATIDFVGQQITSATPLGSTGNYIELTLASGRQFDLYTTGLPIGTALALSSDTHGGTDLVFTSAGAATPAAISQGIAPASQGSLSAGLPREAFSHLAADFISPP